MTVRRSRILIVDDEKDICEFLFRILHKDGYAPIVAHDGEAALEMIRLGMPDLVISDVRMSKMDGIELLRQAKECDPNLPVIIVTGFPGIDGAIQAMRLGAFDYLLKPIDTSDLMNKIQSALQNRAERIEETIFDPSSKAAVKRTRIDGSKRSCSEGCVGRGNCCSLRFQRRNPRRNGDRKRANSRHASQG